RAAGIMLVLYALRGMTDAKVEGIDVPKPIYFMRELEARLVLGALLALLRPVAVIVLDDAGDEAIKSAGVLAGSMGVKRIIWKRDKLTGITGVDMGDDDRD
ncbi:MAG: hypothetical protein MPL62_13400, partial [Alphaproteobacteria bacterium]|nr:hypothetical protein [Alphaproteobacteria bacterium]